MREHMPTRDELLESLDEALEELGGAGPKYESLSERVQDCRDYACFADDHTLMVAVWLLRTELKRYEDQLSAKESPDPRYRHRGVSGLPFTGRLLEQAKRLNAMFSGNLKGDHGWPGNDTDGQHQGGAEWAHPVTCHTDITAPRRLARCRRGVITVGLTRKPDPSSAVEEALKVSPGVPVDVVLHAVSADVEILGGSVKQVTVETDADSAPVVFYVRSEVVGEKELVIDFRQSGAVIGTVTIGLEVCEGAVLEEQVAVAAAVGEVGGAIAEPPDLEIRVLARTDAGTTRLDYIFHSPGGVVDFHYQSVRGKPISGTPEEFQAHVRKRIEGLAKRKDADGRDLTPEEVSDEITVIGRGLYDKLFNDGMRNAYRQFRGKVRTLQITSDEPWIPWELIRVYDGSDPDEIIDDDFLCMQFHMTRWLAGRGCASGRIRIERAACVEAARAIASKPLKYAIAEREYLTRLITDHSGVEDVSPRPASGEAVRGLLDTGDVDLWHFAAHGEYDAVHPNESALILEDSRVLRAEDIHGKRRTHISRDKPLVFLNACRVGQLGWSLTGLGGWASTWVGRSRCGAFIAPLWAVDDKLAYEFAQAFYESLSEGKPIGGAAHFARTYVRGLAPDTPTWLAYSVYSQPNALVAFAA